MTMKLGNTAAMGSLDEVRARAEKADVSVIVNRFRPSRGRRVSLHVMFNAGPQRLADYWPSTGTIIAAGEKTIVESLDAALDVAIAAADRLDEIVSGHHSEMTNHAHQPRSAEPTCPF
jgi:hypothetical protein